jgi:predicted dehydrogenase
MLKVAVVGCGYWGPNLIRNFVMYPDTEVIWVCDINESALNRTLSPYPSIKKTQYLDDVLCDASVEAVVIATPVNTHFSIAKRCIESGRHVLVEKPLAMSLEEGTALVQLAEEKNLQLMCDHTFCYTGTVQKIKEIVDSGSLGDILYFDSVRINLGLFQSDINVIWDLAPHDLSILEYLFDNNPVSVSAHGVSHAGNGIENIAYVTISYNNSFLAHLHLNWLSPVKLRTTILGGSEKMLVWNDMESVEKVKIYDKGITIRNGEAEERRQLLVSYRSGDMYAPKIDTTEALYNMVNEFYRSVTEKRPAETDGHAGLRVLQILEACDRSIKADGANVRLRHVGAN